MDDPPALEPPDKILRRLLARVKTGERPIEKTYLRSVNPKHRWARASFPDLDEEFRYKTIWVAKQLREHFGSPDHSAFVALTYVGVRGVRAAAWSFGATLGYVLERRAIWSRRYVTVVLGATEPGWPRHGHGPDGLDARDAVMVLAHARVH